MFASEEPIGSSTKKDLSKISLNHITVAMQPYTRAHLCSLVVKDPTRGYQLKTKWSWSEGVRYTDDTFEPNKIGTDDFQDENFSNYYSSAPKKKSPQTFLSNTPNQLPNQPRTPNSYRNKGSYFYDDRNKHTPISSALVPITTGSYQHNDRKRATPPKPRIKIEEISPQVFLETEIVDNLQRVEITYTLQVLKQTRVTFEADFTGSSNLMLLPDGGLVCEAVVDPMQKMQIGQLRNIDPNSGWKLVCRYKWQEEDIMVKPETIRIPSNIPSDLNTQKNSNVIPSKPQRGNNNVHDIRSLLASINLEGYADFFDAEELNLDLLKVMAKNESEFRNSLEMLGVNKMGHRERILVAVKNLPAVE